MPNLYRVILEGAAEDVPAHVVKQKIAGLFGLPAEKVELLFCKAPIVVKGAVGKGGAEKLVQVLGQLGARARIEPMPETAPPQQRLDMEPAPGAQGSRKMKCPACNQEQPVSDTCVFCGVVIAKAQEKEKEQPPQSPAGFERRRKPRPGHGLPLTQMGVGEMLSRSFSLIGDRLPTFAGIILLPGAAMLGCALLVILALYGYLSMSGIGAQEAMAAVAMGGPGQLPVSPGALIGLFAGVMLFMLFFTLWSHASLTYAISQMHLGYGVGVISSYRSAFKRMAGLFTTTLTTGLLIIPIFVGVALVSAIGAGILGPVVMIAGVIGGFAFAMRYALIEKVVVIEGLTGGEARARSAELVSGKMLRLLGIAFVFGFIAWGAQFVGDTVTPFFAEGLPLPLNLLAMVAVQTPIVTFATAFPAIGLCLFYFDARIRTDGTLTHQDLAKSLEEVA